LPKLEDREGDRASSDRDCRKWSADDDDDDHLDVARRIPADANDSLQPNQHL